MMMALAATHRLPTVLVPGGVTLSPEQGDDAGRVQSIGARFAHGHHVAGGSRDGVSGLRRPGRRMPIPGYRRDLSGRRRSARSYPPSAALLFLLQNGVNTTQILTPGALRNALWCMPPSAARPELVVRSA